MRRLVQRSRADDSVREDTFSHLINSVNLFVRRKRDKRYIRKRVKIYKSFFV